MTTVLPFFLRGHGFRRNPRHTILIFENARDRCGWTKNGGRGCIAKTTKFVGAVAPRCPQGFYFRDDQLPVLVREKCFKTTRREHVLIGVDRILLLRATQRTLPRAKATWTSGNGGCSSEGNKLRQSLFANTVRTFRENHQQNKAGGWGTTRVVARRPLHLGGYFSSLPRRTTFVCDFLPSVCMHAMPCMHVCMGATPAFQNQPYRHGKL